MSIGLRFAVALLLSSLAACGPRPLPTYAERSVEQSLAVLADRAASVRSFSGAGTLTMQNPAQGTVTLEAALVGRRPDQLRVRAWKLGRSMADVLLDGDQVTSKLDRRVPEEGLTEGLAGMRSVLLALDESFYRNAVEVPGGNASVLRLRGVTAGGMPMRCEIDRATLTTQRVWPEHESVSGSAGGSMGDEDEPYFALERYREIENTDDADGTDITARVVWPMRIRAVRGEQEATVRFDWVEFNGEIAPGALPAQRAGEP